MLSSRLKPVLVAVVCLIGGRLLLAQDFDFSSIKGDLFTFGIEAKAIDTSLGTVYQGVFKSPAKPQSKSDLLYASDFKTPTKAKLTQETVNDYRVIITEACHKYYLAKGATLITKEDTRNPANASIGMSRSELYEVAGLPTRINTTKTATGETNQLIYEKDDKVTYIYLVDEKVKTIQLQR